jgi:phospholipid/cholesterol/gamma-HCH transport system substrate-binding protein
MNIEKSSCSFIHKDVNAKVSTDGLVGNKIIALSGGSSRLPPIEDGDVLSVASSISSDELLNTLQVNNKNLVEITGNLKTISQHIMNGQGTLGKLVNDTAAYDHLRNTLATLQQTAVNSQRLSTNLAAYTARLQTKGVLANDLVSDTVVFSKLRSTVTDMALAAQEADSLARHLKNAGANVDAQLNSSQSPAGVILNDSVAARSLLQTIVNLERSTGKLDTNMEAVRHNFLFRGYFRRLAKKQKKEQEMQQKAAQQ